MHKITLLKFLFLFFVASALTVDAQIVIGKPNLGFSQACASPTFNTYDLSFVFSPDTGVSSTNQFIVELSDENGEFDNPTVVYTSTAGAITSSPASVNFQFPTFISGESYKIRVKSTSPVATSTRSDAFAAYYKTQDTPFTINNLIGNAAFCSGGSYILTIDNPGNGNNDSPLNYPDLTFNWYKQTTETNSVFVSEGESLTVTESGTYFVETNYGSCTSNSFSNRVTISEASATTETSINSSLGNPFCSDNGPTTLSAVNGEEYQWFKDGEAIPDSNTQTILTEESGEYTVSINLGSCSTTGTISLDSKQFTGDIDIPEVYFLGENEVITVTVSTSANSPDFYWYYNDSVIEGANANSLDVSETGNYRVVVSQTVDCEASREFAFSIMSTEDVEEIPNVISPNGDGINDTWIIPQQYLSGTDTSIMVFDSQGKVVFETTNYTNEWPQEQITINGVNPVYYYIISNQGKNQRKGSITVIN